MGKDSSGREKVRKICELLREETLAPAKREAQDVVAQAKEEAERIVREAKRKESQLLEEAKRRIEEEHNVFRASINVACKKSLGILKQQVREELFHRALDQFVGDAMRDSSIVVKCIEAIVQAIREEGLATDVLAVVSSRMSKEEVNQQLVKGVLDSLKGGSVEVGEFSGGVEIRVEEHHFVVDMTEETLKALLAQYLQEEFHSAIFQN